MAINRKNSRYCQVLYNAKYYDVIIAVSDLDEVDNILQEWAINKFGVATVLDLPSALIQNKDLSEVLTSLAIDRYVYLESPSSRYMDMPKSAGLSGNFPILPTALVLGDYVCPETMAYLFSLPTMDGVFGEFSVPEVALTPSVGMNYLGIYYNSTLGTASWVFYTSESSFNYSSIIPVAKVMYFGGTVYNIPYGQTGDGLAEKIVRVMNSRKPAEIIDPFTFENTALFVELGEIVVSNGVEEITCPAVNTASLLNDMYLHYKDNSSVWQTSKVTEVDNLQCQTASGLDNLLAGEFVVNQIFRVIDGTNLLIFSVLSDRFASLQDAINSGDITDLPETVKSSAVCVGRVIVEQSSIAPLMQKVQKITFGN